MTIENYPLDPDEENPQRGLIIFRNEAWEQEQWNRTHFLTGRMMETPEQPLPIYFHPQGFQWRVFWINFAWSFVVVFVLGVLLFALAL